MKQFENEENRLKAVKSRHEAIMLIVVAFLVTIVLTTGIAGCTYYNTKKLEVPVKYEHNENTEYQRGN
jgi:hypothetical protein